MLHSYAWSKTQSKSFKKKVLERHRQQQSVSQPKELLSLQSRHKRIGHLGRYTGLESCEKQTRLELEMVSRSSSEFCSSGCVREDDAQQGAISSHAPKPPSDVEAGSQEL